MKRNSTHEATPVTNPGISMYRLLLATIILVCLSYVTFAHTGRPEPPRKGKSAAEFISFKTERASRAVVVTWDVRNESTVSHYILEKSINGRDFKTAAYIFPNENTQQANHYKYKDVLVKNYRMISYRVRAVHTNHEVQSTGEMTSRKK